MYLYGLLEPNCYYLVQKEEDTPIELIKVTVETDHCMYIFKYNDELTTEWHKKTDKLHDIIECLSDETVEQWGKEYYNNSEESYYEEDDE